MIVWGLFDNVFSTVISLLFLFTVVSTIIVIIMDNRNPFKTLSWVMVLVFLPVLGLVLYYFFGRDTRKEKLISRKGFERLSRHPMHEFQRQKSLLVSEGQSQLMRFCHQVNGSLPFDGNSIQVYSDGYAMLAAVLKSISQAKHHIHIQFYIFEDDAIGHLVRDALMDKAREGVEVRVLYDDVGCWKVSHLFYDEMREAGIEVRGFHWWNEHSSQIFEGCFLGDMEGYVHASGWEGCVWPSNGIPDGLVCNGPFVDYIFIVFPGNGCLWRLLDANRYLRPYR